MKALRISFSCIACFTAIAGMLQAQTPTFSQYYATGLYLNPALAGIEKSVLIGMNYRSQWANANLPYRTCQLTFIQPFIREGVRPKHLGGWGVSILNDEAGPARNFVTQSVSVSGSYNLQLNRKGTSFIALGGQVSALQQKVNANAFRWSSQYSPTQGFDASLPGETGFADRVTSPVVNAGAIWYFSRRRPPSRAWSAFQGVSVSNINQPASFSMDQSARTILYKLHGGMSFDANSDLEVSPNYLIQYQGIYQINVGSYVSYPMNKLVSQANRNIKVIAGAWYRVRDAVIVSAGFTNQNWNAAISYDTNTSALRKYLGNASATEISLAYKFAKAKTYQRFSSPLI